MTTIYIPRLIETAEQAEALPVGTVAFLDEGTARSVAHKIGVDAWIRTDMGDLYSPAPNAAMYPGILPDAWTALVPIEAEEEWSERAIAEGEFIGTIRLVTHWEEA